MKRAVIAIILSIVLGIPLIFGGVVAVAYYAVKPEKVVPAPIVTYNALEFSPSSYSWNHPIIGGIIYRNLQKTSAVPDHIGVITSEKFGIGFPAEYPDAILTIKKDNVDYWQGKPAEWQDVYFAEDGEYMLSLVCTVEKKSSRPYGSVTFEIYFTVALAPIVEASNAEVAQGDVLVINLGYLPENTEPVGTADFGGEIKALFFFRTAPRSWMAYVPISFNQDPGAYIAAIDMADTHVDLAYTVLGYDFPRQDMEIDMSDPDINKSQSAEAIAQFNEAIIPLLLSFDAEIYWSGEFLVPAEGRISTDYGTRRYTNGGTTASIHKGMDIAADEGAPVIAPNSGKVVYADFLDTTGNTLVIDYGGGLKSYFFHMNSLSVEEGQMVEKGQFVGEVGSTGYSTGPHLHYEIRVGQHTFDPARLTNGDCQLYFKMPKVA